ncbi:hypothetical protein [Rhabdochlamydiaceae symbiont of Dictyostelium giganteum]|uniref:hypothetical protein n=1 Tax=Rhabdochlamydiaceae symbiont of Dictyostelium giganteum TaxID=3342349 RepID=UPI00384EDCED
MLINLQSIRDLSYSALCYGCGLNPLKMKVAEDFLKRPYQYPLDALPIQSVEFTRWAQLPIEYNYLDLESYYSDWAFSSEIPNIGVIQQMLEESLALIKKEKEHRFFYIPSHFYPTNFLASQIMTRVIHRKIYEMTLENPSLSLERISEIAITSLQGAALLDQVERRRNPHAKLKYVTYCKGPQSHLTKKCLKNLALQVALLGLVTLILNYNPLHLLKNAYSKANIHDLRRSYGI